jgi:hypothetical protein
VDLPQTRAVDPPQTGAVDPPLRGAVDPPHHGAVDPPRHGAVDPPHRGAVDPPQHGGADPPQHGAVVPPCRGAVDPPQHGGADPPQHGAVVPPRRGAVDPPQDGGADPPQNGAAVQPQHGAGGQPQHGAADHGLVGGQVHPEGNWLSYEDLMKETYPAKSKEVYLSAYRNFEIFLKSENQFAPDVVPTETMLLNYFRYLKVHKKWQATSIWSQYARLNGVLKRRFKTSLKEFPSLSDMLKSFEVGHRVKKASVFTPQQEFHLLFSSCRF